MGTLTAGQSQRRDSKKNFILPDPIYINKMNCRNMPIRTTWQFKPLQSCKRKAGLATETICGKAALLNQNSAMGTQDEPTRKPKSWSCLGNLVPHKQGRGKKNLAGKK